MTSRAGGNPSCPHLCFIFVNWHAQDLDSRLRGNDGLWDSEGTSSDWFSARGCAAGTRTAPAGRQRYRPGESVQRLARLAGGGLGDFQRTLRGATSVSIARHPQRLGGQLARHPGADAVRAAGDDGQACQRCAFTICSALAITVLMSPRLAGTISVLLVLASLANAST